MKETAPRLNPLLLLSDALLLFCALTGFLRSFLSLYAESEVVSPSMPQALVLLCREHSTGELVLLGLCLALCFALVWSLPRLRRLVLFLLAAGWAALVWLCRQTAKNGLLLIFELAADVFERRVGWFAPVNFRLNLTNAQQLIAAEQCFFLGSILLAFLLGWAIVRARRWWLAVLLTLPPLLPGLLADIYPDWVFFLLLAAAWCTMLLTSLCRRAAPSGQGKLTLLTLPAVGILLALILLVFPAEGYERPQWTYTAADRAVEFSNRHLSFLSELDGPFTSRVTYVGSAEHVDLKNAGPLNFSGRTVLQVTSADHTGKVYLRGTSLARYTGESWEPLEDGVYEEYLAELDASGIECTVSPLIHPAYTVSEHDTYTITVKNTGASGSCVYLPYQLMDQNWAEAGLLVVEDAYLARKSGQWTHTVTFRPQNNLRAGYSDQTVWQAQEVYREFVERYYTEPSSALPQSVIDEFMEYAAHREDSIFLSSSFWFSSSSTGDTAPDLDTDSSNVIDSSYVIIGSPLLTKNAHYAAKVVADFLADRCVYDQNTPVTPEGEDFVSWFLTESRQGYCMHFASAAALLLRELGYPTRYVSGFTADLTAGRIAYVPDSAAHAWVEIYLEGYGWYPVEVTPSAASTVPEPEEPTPSESEAPPEPSLTVSPSPTPSMSPIPSMSPTPSIRPSATPNASQMPGQGLPMESGDLVRLLQACIKIVKWLALVAAAALFVWLGQYLPKKHRAKKLAVPDTNKAVLDGYHYLKQLEHWGCQVKSTDTELAQKARFSQHTLTEDEQQTMTVRFDEERTRIAAALSPVPRLLFRYFWGVPAPLEESSHDDP